MARRIGPEGLLRAVFPNVPLEAPIFHYVVEEGKEVSITRALAESLDALPLTQGKGDPEPSPRMSIVLKSLYQIEARQKSTADLAKQFSVSSSTVLSYEGKGLYYLSRPGTARRLKRFFAPTPEQVAEVEERAARLEVRLSEVIAENEAFASEVRQLQENQHRMRTAMLRANIPEPELHDIALLEKTAEGRHAFQRAAEILRERLLRDVAVSRTLNALQRSNIHDAENLEQALENGDIRRLRNVGKRGAELARELLRIAREEVPLEESGS